jgi:hypothetical protein
MDVEETSMLKRSILLSIATFLALAGCGESANRTPTSPSLTSPSFAVSGTEGAIIATDKDDYAPGEVVTITGSGWAAGETVHLTLTEDPVKDGAHEWDVVADADGKFTDQSFTPGQQHLSVTFTLVAAGPLSGVSTQLTFTDGSITVATSAIGTSVQATQVEFAGAGCTGNTISTTTITIPNGGFNIGGLGTNQNQTPSVRLTFVSATGGTFTSWSIASLQKGTSTVSGNTFCITATDNGVSGSVVANITTVAATTTSLVSSANPSTPGQSVTFTATVKSGTPLTAIGSTGAVTFKTGGTSCSDATAAGSPTNLVNGIATYQTSTLSLGTTVVRACFGGTAAYTASEASVSQGVNTLVTTTTVGSSLNPSTFGTSVTFTATVTDGSAAIGANGKVAFKTGGTNCSDAALLSPSSVDLGANGKATFATAAIPAGTTVVRACYEGTSVYNASAGTVSQVVNKANQTITFGPLSGRKYGDLPFAITATGGGSTNPVTFAVDPTSVGCSVATDAESGITTVSITGATPSGRNCVINANQAADANYNAATQVQQSFEIAKAKITVKADAPSKYYGDPDPSPLSYQITSGALVGGDQLSGALTRDAGENVASSPYAITQGTLSAGANYDLTFVGASLTINPRPIVIKALDVSKTYDGDPYASGYSIALVAPTVLGFSDQLSVLGTPDFNTTPAAPVNAGTYPITVSGLSNRNYDIDYVAGTLTIDQRPLTVTADAKSKYFGDPDPSPFTYRITNGTLVSGDAISGVLTRDVGETVAGSPYAIRQGTLTAGPNYKLTFISANLSILAWTLHGFYQPVDMNNIFNTVKGGSTVPLKFEIFSGTRELNTTTSVKNFTAAPIACVAMAGTDEIEITTTGGTVLRYDATDGQFIQNWQTPKSAGSCYRVTMTAQDGSALTAFFKLK